MKYNPPLSLLRSIFRSCAVAILLCIITPLLQAQSPALIYAKAVNNSQPLGGYVQNRAVAVDASGNVFITGYFESLADFDPGAGVANLTATGSTSIFLAKYDASGNYVFAKAIHGSNNGQGLAIAVDGAANVYVSGNFAGTADFDPGTGTVNLTSAGGSDIFLAKYTAAGNYLWAKSMGGTSNDIGRSIVLDASANIYLAGEFSTTVDFDPSLATVTLTSAGSNDIFFAKYDASGNYVYAKGMGSTGIDIGYGIAIDASANAYITGHFVNTVDFDPGVGVVNLTSAGNNDIFLARYDASGNYVYAIKIGGAANDIGYGIAVDASSNAYITGQFQGTVDFDPSGTTVNLISTGANNNTASDIFLARYNASGTYVYAKKMGGTSFDVGFSIALDASNNAYITGQFIGTADFDPGAGTVNLIGAGSYDVFVGKYDASGNYTTAVKIGGTGVDIGHALKLDASSNIYIAGQFESTVDFDPGAGTVNLTSGSTENGYVMKLTNSAGYLWVAMQGGYSNTSTADEGRGIAVDAAGNAYVTGSFQGTADFDPGAGTFNLTSAGDNDIFLAKYDPAGNFIWAKRFGGTGGDVAHGIVRDGSNIYITGIFSNTVDFNPGGTAANLISAGSTDVFIAKYDASGNYVWAIKLGGSSVDAGRALVIDASSNVCIIGDFAGNADFDPSTGTANLVSVGSTDIFFAKYSASGAFVYANKIGSLQADLGYAIATDASSNVYITGSFVFTADFDPGAGVVDLTSTGSSDIFLAKYNAAGNFIWAKRFGSTGTDIGYGIVVNSTSEVHVTGLFEGTVDFNTGGTAANLTSGGSGDIFLAKYDASGNYVWARRMGGTGDDKGYGIAVDGSSNVYLTGQFFNTVDFDPGAGVVNLTSAGSADIFLASYNASGNYLYARGMGNAVFEYGNAIAVNISGNIYITGNFTYTADFYPEGGLSSSIITANNASDVFVAAYNNLISLPLRFESISARVVKNGEAVQINWSAASQLNNAYFEVQRSVDGVHFESVSRVSGCLSCSDLQHYTATDNHPLKGTSFYRIKQVDVDGKASYSTIVSITLSKSKFTLDIYPTVTSDAFTVQVQNNGLQKRALIQILCADGKLVQQQTISLQEGENRFSYSLAGEARSIYYVRLISEAEHTSLSASIIKQ